MSAPDSLYAGYGMWPITPPLGTPFGGFAIERQQGATGVHDPLYATAVVVTGSGGTVAVVSCDLQLITPHVVARARAGIATLTGIESGAVMVHATHVHSAPGGDAAEATIPGLDSCFSTAAAEEVVVNGIVGAVADAWADRCPAFMTATSGTIAGIGDSRHRPLAGPQFAALARLERRGSAPVVMANYGCHASVLGPDNTLLSADYPGVIRSRAAKRNERLLFLNGPAGDVSTRATRREQTFRELERLGTELDSQLAVLKAGMSTVAGTAVTWLQSRVCVPARPIDRDVLAGAVATAGQRLEQAGGAARPGAEQALRRARFRLERLDRFDGAPIAIDLQAFQIAGAAVLGVGGELFSEIGAHIAAGSPHETTLIAAPVNGSVGNIPTPALAVQVGAMVTGEAAALVTAEALALLRRLRELRGVEE